jgi:hypothetical protein
MITFVTWLWGSKYSKADVERLRIGIDRHVLQPHNFVCLSDRVLDSYSYPIHERDKPLLRMPGCFARLRLFDPSFQDQVGLADKIVNVDLDVVVTGELDKLFDRDESFVILSGVNASNPCPFNGSIFMFRKGTHPELFTGFSPDKAQAIPYFTFPDDQAWFHYHLPNAATWTTKDGIYAFEKPGWPKGTQELPADARLVVFPGWRSPSQYRDLPWVYDNWTSVSLSPKT